MGRNKVRYSEIVPKKRDWPIVQLSKDRRAFMDEVANDAYQKFLIEKSGALREEIETTIHREKLRMKNNPWKVDPQNERSYWNGIQARLLDIDIDKKEEADEEEKKILKDIMLRYSEEISGNFRKSYYRFCSKVW